MKKIHIMILVALLTACNQAYEIVEPTLDVRTSQFVFKAGEPVEFTIDSESDIITFYSGEFGNDYNYRNTERFSPASAHLSFDVKYTTSGNSRLLNPCVIPISWSSDFSGEYTWEAMEQATWTDITEKFTFPAEDFKVGSANGSTTTSNKDIEIESCFTEEDKPIYIRFKYRVEKFTQEINTGRSTVVISNFHINGLTPQATIPVYSMKDLQWGLVPTESWNVSKNNCSLPAAQEKLTFGCEWNPKNDSEIYAVVGPVNKAADVNSGMEAAVCLKTVADPYLRSYSHTYSTPGEYEAVFVAINSSVFGRSETVRKVNIKVIQDNGEIISPEDQEWKDK